ncbi:hypothetical protein FA10DRAFT_269018 [Acaromyces ingoldii]|uniref:BZIP domain-containing protein n=1 Tax=Acaromyces ingoldii TaxID=215250 RepID=A0A316YFT8_9BASI|nr:hypothetical protein FA10DRAFT_269018 [Acaromyces ingoldii]PWN87704.1 hypothetical protein FA10DRAFT_269018 [Acaromyces ingoldii]
MSSFDDPSSFLFGLNQFPTPPQDSNHQSGSSSHNHHTNPSTNGPGTAATTAASTPANLRLDPFAGATGAEHGDPSDVLDGAGFADQLALWTNANFSFDGPTGHALLGDEDKEKEEAAAKKDEEEKRAGKRPRNNNNHNDDEFLGAAGNGKARQRDPSSPLDANEPTHQRHKEQAALQQQQHYFAPPTSRADEGRRPGYANNAAMPSAGGAPPSSDRGTAADRGNDQQHLHQQQPLPQGMPAFSHQPFAPGAAFSGQQQAPQLDLTSILALQQLLSSNPLALAGLSGLSPGLNLNSIQGILQAQQALPQQQEQQQQQQPFAAGQSPQFWPSFNPQLTSPTFSTALNSLPGSAAPGHHGHGHDDDDEVNERELANSKAQSANRKKPSLGKAAARDNHDRHDSPSSSDGDKRNSMSDSSSSKTKSERAAILAEKAALRDEIPPLQLIDTGNPEADAEANRVAIEEDKRRRNTAASARFRVKKKQREAALEAHTKELTDKVDSLQREMEKLRNENTWLKGLIQVRPANADASGSASSPQSPSAGSNVQQQQQAINALHQMQVQIQAAAAAAAAHQQQQQSPHNKTHLSPILSRQRDTGVRPRGVGTNAEASSSSAAAHEAGSKRDRED